MATPSGAISFEDIRTEFGQPSANNSLNNYYSGGPALGAPLANVPASGAISMSELRIIEKTGGSGDRVNVGSGVPNGTHIIFTTTGDCYSNTTGTAALLVPSGRTGATTLVVASGHNISGKSGAGGQGQGVTHSDNSNAAGTGSTTAGAAGGPAIQLASTTHLDNNGNLYGGSGGGAGGSAFGAPITGFISNGITCTTTDLKGIVTNTNGSTRFTIGTAGSGGGGGNNPASQSDGAGGNLGGGGHTTNFANGNRSVTQSGTQCTANTSYFTDRSVKMVASGNAGGVGSGGGSGFGGHTNGSSGGGNGNAGSNTTAANGSTNFPTISENGNSVSNLSGVGGDGASGGAVGNAITGWNSYSVTVHGIVSTQGSFNGGIS